MTNHHKEMTMRRHHADQFWEDFQAKFRPRLDSVGTNIIFAALALGLAAAATITA